jgi:predicted naringenin-chalcone synthase
MKAFILALATAVPQYYADQATIAQKIIDLMKLDSKNAKFIENIYNKTQIKRRYCVLKDFTTHDSENNKFLNKEFLNNIPGTKIRNDIYMQEAPILAKNAAQSVLTNWAQDSKKITHIISVSCTGVMAPGIEYLLQKEFNMDPTVQRIGINFMGCFGAFRAIAVANSIAKENPKNRILIVCTELCSLHFQVSAFSDVLVGNALFADGAAALIIGCEPSELEKPLLSIENNGSYAIENTLDKMTWTITDHGCLMRLSKEIPNIIELNAQKTISDFVQNKNFNDLTWAIHPGGKAIVEALERSLNLTKSQTQSAWNVLENYGNMSSATFLFVLKDLLEKEQKNKYIIGIGFGPGLSMEMILLKAMK